MVDASCLGLVVALRRKDCDCRAEESPVAVAVAAVVAVARMRRSRLFADCMECLSRSLFPESSGSLDYCSLLVVSVARPSIRNRFGNLWAVPANQNPCSA